MIIQPVPVRCLKCHHEWEAELVGWAPAQVVIASMNAVRCSECGAGSGHVVMRREVYPDPLPEEAV